MPGYPSGRRMTRRAHGAAVHERVDLPPGADGRRAAADRCAGMVIRTLGRTDYETTWRAMRTFTDARGRRNTRRDLAHRAPPVYTLGPGRPARARAAREGIPVSGRPRRAGHLSRAGPARRVYAHRPAPAASASAMVRRIEQAVIEWLARWDFRMRQSLPRPGSTCAVAGRMRRSPRWGSGSAAAARSTGSRSTSTWISRPSPHRSRAAFPALRVTHGRPGRRADTWRGGRGACAAARRAFDPRDDHGRRRRSDSVRHPRRRQAPGRRQESRAYR